MVITVNIATGNAAFSDGDKLAEVRRLLLLVAERVGAGIEGGRLMDYNGNGVGTFDVWEKEEGDEGGDDDTSEDDGGDPGILRAVGLTARGWDRLESDIAEHDSNGEA